MSRAPANHANSEPVPASEGRRASYSSLPSNSVGAAVASTGEVRGTKQRTYTGDEGGSAPPARPAPATVGGEAAARLDMRTTYDEDHPAARRPGYRVLLRDYGEGLVEATVTINSYNRFIAERPPATATFGEQHIEDNRERAVRRAKAAIRQSIMAARLDHMLTLTYRENQTCPALAWKHFARFTRLVRDHYRGRPYPFVAVLERQKRGAMHVHAAVHGHQDVRLLRKLWHQAIGSTEGNIDVKFFRQKLPKLARYLSKYITKDLDTEHQDGDHRYKRSRGIFVPAVLAFIPYEAALDWELLNLFELHAATISFHKNNLSRVGPKWLWACSW